MTAARLEQRYRRLLAWFPAEHRRVYGEEMIGVLLASGSDSQGRPRIAEIADLAAGGLRTRLRRLRTGNVNPHWRDALAVFSVVAPIVLFGWLAAGYLAEVELAVPYHYQEVFSRVDATLLTTLIATAVAIAALAICPALTRRGRTAIAASIGIVATVCAVIGLVQAFRVFAGQDDELTLYLSILAGMEILALVASPGPARGWQLLSRRGLIVLAAISVAVIVASAVSATRNWDFVNITSDVSGIVSVLGVALTLRWPVGSRLLVLWAIPGYQFIGFAAAQYLFTRFQYSSWAAFTVEFRYLPTAVVAVLVGLATWWSGHPGRRRAPEPSG